MSELSPEMIEAAHLPTVGARKAYEFMDARAAGFGASHAAIAAEFDAREALERAEAEWRRWQEYAQAEGRRLRPEDEAPYRDKIEARRAEVSRCIESVRRASAAAQEAASESDRIADFLAENRGKKWRHVGISAPKLKPGQTHSEAVATARSDLDKLGDERQAVELAPAPAADLLRHTKASIQRLAAKGEPSLDRRIRGTDPFKLERHLENPGVGVKFLIWLWRDLIEAEVEHQIGEDQPGALTDAEREKCLAAVDARLLEVARAEEAIIVAAAAQGQRIPRRPDANPLAVLEIAEA